MRRGAIDNLVKAVNEKYPCWGVKVEGWEIARKPGLITVTLFAEANGTSFPAPLMVILQSGEVFFGGAAYINFGLRYSTIINCPQAAAIPIAAYLIGRYFKEIAPHFKPRISIYPDFKEAYSQILWQKENLTKPVMGAKAIVRKRDHKIIVLYCPDIETETDIYDAPQIIRVGLALCAL